MSTNYLILKPKISFEQLKQDFKSNKVPGLSLEDFDEKSDSFCITDGTSFLWVTGEENDYWLDRFGSQSTTQDIIEHLISHIQCEDVIHEYDERYDELLNYIP